MQPATSSSQLLRSWLAQLQEQELGAFHQDEIDPLDWERQKEIDQEKAEDLFRKGLLSLVFSARLFLKAHSLSMAHMNAWMMD